MITQMLQLNNGFNSKGSSVRQMREQLPTRPSPKNESTPFTIVKSKIAAREQTHSKGKRKGGEQQSLQTLHSWISATWPLKTQKTPIELLGAKSASTRSKELEEYEGMPRLCWKAPRHSVDHIKHGSTSHRERVRNMTTDTTPTPTKISKQSNSDNTDEAKTTTDLPEGNGRKKKKKKARTILWTPSECRLTGRERREKKKENKLGRSSGHQAKTTADSPEGSGEKKKEKKS